jgi:hypothetical protein
MATIMEIMSDRYFPLEVLVPEPKDPDIAAPAKNT